MKTMWFLVAIVSACLLSVSGSMAVPTFAQGPDTPVEAGPQAIVGAGFTYQGQIKQGGAPFSGNCDFQFTLWDSLTAGAQVAGAVTKTNVAVSRGVFTAPDISFGVSTNPMYLSFSGDARWLQIAARCPAGSGTYTTLIPRQAMSATPYALSLRPGAQIAGDVFNTPPYNSVLRLENKSATAGPDGADALSASTQSDWGAAVRGYGLKGFGGVFTSYAGFALVTHGPSLIANRTPQQIGMLRWYDANTTVPSVTVGQWCDQLAFDGEHMWVTVWATGKVVKVRASDMAIIGTYDAGPGPNPLIFDGDEIWIGSETSGQITKLRAADGVSTGSFSTGSSGHWGMAFDGTNVWVTNKDTDNVTKIRASDNTIVGTYAVGDVPTGIAFDGTHVWVANSNAGTVTKLRASDGGLVGTYTVGAGPNGVAFDGANIWVANGGSATVSVLRAYDGSTAHVCTVSAGPMWLAWDGYHMWVTHYLEQGLITQLISAYGIDCGPKPTFKTGSRPIGIAFDGANMWVADSYSWSISKH
jgi:outer membrane lipoprotein-sorting protein